MAEDRAGGLAVVDDDQAVLESLKFLLEVLGCKVKAYTSAYAFLEDDAFRPDCMIVDQHMPHMTGLELAQRLRDTGTAIPVLLITGSPTPSIVARARQLGVKAVLEKPAAEADLMKFLHAHSRRRGLTLQA